MKNQTCDSNSIKMDIFLEKAQKLPSSSELGTSPTDSHGLLWRLRALPQAPICDTLWPWHHLWWLWIRCIDYTNTTEQNWCILIWQSKPESLSTSDGVLQYSTWTQVQFKYIFWVLILSTPGTRLALVLEGQWTWYSVKKKHRVHD